MLETGRILPLKVLAKPLDAPKQTAGGIIIPENANKLTISSEVVLVGDSTPNIEMKAKIGDKIIHGKHSFVIVEIDDEPYRLLNQADILFFYK
jgi:co-chaperonin GroES (HSP10)